MNKDCNKCEIQDLCPNYPIQGIGIGMDMISKLFPNLTEDDLANLKKCRADARLELAFRLTNLTVDVDKLSVEAATDPLTKLYNRRFLEDRLKEIFALSQRHKKPFSMIHVDLDHFKDVNDSHGHAAGDQALVMVANILSTSTRQEDIVARIGGEEFAILLPETNLEEAILVAEKLRKIIEKAETIFQGERINLTASLGVTQMKFKDQDRKGHDYETEQSLMQRADALIYEAKEGGRNRVVAEAEHKISKTPLKVTTA